MWRNVWSTSGRCGRVRPCAAGIGWQYCPPEDQLFVERKHLIIPSIIRLNSNLPGLQSVKREQIESNTFDMVRAGLQLSLRMSRHITPWLLILQWYIRVRKVTWFSFKLLTHPTNKCLAIPSEVWMGIRERNECPGRRPPLHIQSQEGPKSMWKYLINHVNKHINDCTHGWDPLIEIIAFGSGAKH